MTCTIHEHHNHQHNKDCGHPAIKHNDHIDYLHDGHLHHEHNGHYDEHTLEVNAQNPNECNQHHHCNGHVHGEGCGHLTVPHGDHVDYLVDGRLHHPHGDHCDDHGAVELA